MVYTIDFGLFPFAGLLLGGCLYAIYYWGLQLRCQARWAQAFIVVAMVLTTISIFVSPARVVQQPHLQQTQFQQAHLQPLMEEKETPIASATAPAPESNSTPLPHGRGRGWVSGASPLSLQQLYIIGVVVVAGYFLVQLVYLFWFRRQQELKDYDDDADIYEMADQQLPFSFGRSVFLPSTLADDVKHYVIMHELSHIRHRHFLWLCFLQLLVCAGWFNPFVWLFFSEMRLQQELEVDGDVLKAGVDREQYQLSLVCMATHQGKWILTRHAFFGEPLKKRLLFMNTPIDQRRARLGLTVASLLSCFVLTALIAVSCQVREYERDMKHPFQGCWEMDWSMEYGTKAKKHPTSQRIKFCGDYGDLTMTCNLRDGVNIDFSIEGMEQRLKDDTLRDAHGHAIQYRVEDNLLTWRRKVLPGDDGDEEGEDYIEQWHRVKPDQQIVDLLQHVANAKNWDHEHLLNGVWRLDSIRWEGNTSPYVHVNKRVGKVPFYLLVNDPYYLFMAYKPTVDEQTMCFYANGYCGEISVKRNGYVQLQKDIYELYNSDNMGRIVLVINESRNPYGHRAGVYRYYYHRTTMPNYLKRMFQPALRQE